MLSLGLNLVKTAISRVISLVLNNLRSTEDDGSHNNLRSTEDDGSHNNLRAGVEV